MLEQSGADRNNGNKNRKRCDIIAVSLLLCHFCFAASHIACSAAFSSFFCATCATFATLSASISASVSINPSLVTTWPQPLGNNCFQANCHPFFSQSCSALQCVVSSISLSVSWANSVRIWLSFIAFCLFRPSIVCWREPTVSTSAPFERVWGLSGLVDRSGVCGGTRSGAG
jgi:hypothetical protein